MNICVGCCGFTYHSFCSKKTYTAFWSAFYVRCWFCVLWDGSCALWSKRHSLWLRKHPWDPLSRQKKDIYQTRSHIQTTISQDTRKYRLSRKTPPKEDIYQYISHKTYPKLPDFTKNRHNLLIYTYYTYFFDIVNGEIVGGLEKGYHIWQFFEESIY